MFGFKAFSSCAALLCMAISPDFSFWGEGIRGSGNLVKQDREVGQIHAVKITNHGDLFISIGEETKLVIEVEDNLQEYIKTEVSDGVLKIGNSKGNLNLRPKKPMSYYLTVQEGQLNSLTATSHGDIDCPSLKSDSVSIHSTSHGDIKIESIEGREVKLKFTSHGDLKIGSIEAQTLDVRQTSHSNIYVNGGHVTDLDLNQTSHGNFKAVSMQVKSASIHQTSHGLVKISVSDHLDVRATSHGDVYYKGDPQTQIRAGKRATVKRMQ